MPLITRFPWHPCRSKWPRITGVVALFIAVTMSCTLIAEPEQRERWWILFASTFALFGIALLSDQYTRVDPNTLTIVRETHLFGRLCVWRWRNHASQFTGVTIKRVHHPDDGNDTLFIGLVRRSGRFMAISYCYTSPGQPSFEAEQIARSFAEATGLELLVQMACD